jgi:hypothetical protein
MGIQYRMEIETEKSGPLGVYLKTRHETELHDTSEAAEKAGAILTKIITDCAAAEGSTRRVSQPRLVEVEVDDAIALQVIQRQYEIDRLTKGLKDIEVDIREGLEGGDDKEAILHGVLYEIELLLDWIKTKEEG